MSNKHVNAINPLVAFYDVHSKKGGMLFLFCLGHNTRLRGNNLQIFLSRWFKPVGAVEPKNRLTYTHTHVTRTINSTSDYALWTLYSSYFDGIRANIELQVYSVTCCWLYVNCYLYTFLNTRSILALHIVIFIKLCSLFIPSYLIRE
jgi:hypothetical protein